MGDESYTCMVYNTLYIYFTHPQGEGGGGKIELKKIILLSFASIDPKPIPKKNFGPKTFPSIPTSTWFFV